MMVNQSFVTFLLLLPVVSIAFGNLPPKLSDLFASNFVQNLRSIRKDETARRTATVDPGVALLQELGITRTTPKPFQIRPDQIPDVLSSALPAVFRFGSGVFANGYGISLTTRRPSEYTILAFGDYQVKETSQPGRTTQVEPLILYEFEGCPFCRKVREAVSILGLTVTYRPCPQNGSTFRREIKSQFGPDATFPFLQDPNTGIQLFESDQILDYVFRTYGNGEIPWTLRGGAWVPLTAGLGLVWRGGGSRRRNALPAPSQPLLLWSYEGSPFTKLVRERLCELELPHTQVSCPRGSPNRQKMLEEKGRFQVPYIEDPNTGVRLWESEAIVEYLQKMYGVKDSPVKYM